MTKLCNFIEAVYLPWRSHRPTFRPYQEVLDELASFKWDNSDDSRTPKNTFINQHVLRTIGFALSNKSVNSETKKMIQLVRHQFSRKRDCCLPDGVSGDKTKDIAEDRDLLDIVSDNQLDVLCLGKRKSAVDVHLEELRLNCDSLMAVSSKNKASNVNSKFVLGYKEAQKQLAFLKADALQKLTACRKNKYRTAHSSAPFIVDRAKFFHKMNDGQKEAGEYILDMLNKERHNDQLLMLLHGPPGTGKSFIIERLQEYTNVDLRITATSGIAAMSLKGTTIDWFLAKGRRKEKRPKVEIVRQNLGDARLLVVDEVSMLGCHKLLEIDSILRKVRKVPAPFGGLDVIFVGDFAQLAPVKQLSILDAMVNTTLSYTGPAEYAIKTTALMRLFRKFELTKFCRSENCPLLCSILTRFRRTDSKEDSVTVKDIKDIGVATHDTFAKDVKFRSAPFLVATRKERDALTLRAGRIWARKHGVPLYWWWKRPYRGEDSKEDDDFAAESYSSRCCGTKEFFLKGAPCILKHNIAPSEGYANGTKGTMVNIIYKSGLQLPDGEPGELLKIEPPDYINITVHNDNGTTVVPCKRQFTEIPY